MNKKGFAVSGILYTVLVIFLTSMVIILFNLQNRKTILDELKLEAVEAVEEDNNYEYLLNEINNLKAQLSDPVLLGTIETTDKKQTISADTTPYRKILVEIVQKSTGIIFLSKEFYISHLNLNSTNGYNAMDSLYHSSSWTMYYVYDIRKDSLGAYYISNSWKDSTTIVKFYGIK